MVKTLEMEISCCTCMQDNNNNTKIGSFSRCLCVWGRGYENSTKWLSCDPSKPELNSKDRLEGERKVSILVLCQQITSLLPSVLQLIRSAAPSTCDKHNKSLIYTLWATQLGIEWGKRENLHWQKSKELILLLTINI